MEVAPIHKNKLSDEVMQAIERMIVENNLKPGDKLPSQAELSKELQVGTRSIREAIKSLESRGLVEIHQGKGIFVKENKIDHFLEVLTGSFVFHFPTDGDLLIDLNYFRKMIESSIMFEVATSPRTSFLADMDELMIKMDEAIIQMDLAEYNELDIRWHKRIIEESGNKIVITFYNHLYNLLLSCFSRTGNLRNSRASESILEHKKMLDYIRIRDAVKARAGIEEHIQKTINKLYRLKSGLDQDSETGDGALQ